MPLSATTDGDGYQLWSLNPPGEEDNLLALCQADSTDNAWVAGGVRVKSYPLLRQRLVVVPVGSSQASFTKAQLQTDLNAIYAQAVCEWEVSIDAALPLAGIDDLSQGITVGETDYSEHQRQVWRALVMDRNPVPGAFYLFIIPGFKDHPAMTGYMPLKSGYGFLAPQATPRDAAHELGHGAFNLRHTFSNDNPYKVPEGTQNLMDYPSAGSGQVGSELWKYQWDYIHNPEGGWFLWEDMEEGAMVGGIDVLNTMVTLRLCREHKVGFSITKKNNGKINTGTPFFKHITQAEVFLLFEKIGSFSNISFSKDEKYASAYHALFYQIKLSDFGLINCLSESDRDAIYDFLTSKKNNYSLFGTETLSLNGEVYNYEYLYTELEKIKVDLMRQNVYSSLTSKEKFILDLPLSMWSRGFDYGGVFLFNWLVGGGDIQIDDALFQFIDSWQLLNNRNNEYLAFIESNKNKTISKSIEIDVFRLYALRDIRAIVMDTTVNINLNSTLYPDSVLNFSRFSIEKSDLTGSVNEAHTCAFGSFTCAYNLEGIYLYEEKQIEIKKVWQVIDDRFDFGGIQPLGAWHSSIFAPFLPIELLNLTNFEMFNYFNSTFRSFRAKTGIGEDFRITGRRVVSKHINKIKLHTDGAEYK